MLTPILVLFTIIVSLAILPSINAEMIPCKDLPNLKHEILGGKIISCLVDKPVGSLILEYETNSDGELQVKIPRNIIDAKLNTCEDDNFFVLIDGAETTLTEKRTTFSRTLVIPFADGTTQLEIISSVQYTNYSHQLKCSPKDNPRHQLSYGILPHNVLCNGNLVLIKKTTDNAVACVKPESVNSLVARGWGQSLYDDGSSEFHFDNGNTTVINYKIHNSVVTDIHKDNTANSLIIELNSTSDGRIIVSIPRSIIDARLGADGKSGEDDSFIVLVGNEEAVFEERSDASFREFSIPFPSNAQQIEIIGTWHP